MSQRSLLSLALLLGLAAPLAASAQAAVTAPAEARQRVGSTLTVCGLVADAQYLARGNRLTVLTFDSPDPEQAFSAVVLVSVRSQMRVAPEQNFLNKEVCVKGRVTMLQNEPRIIVASLDQIWLRR